MWEVSPDKEDASWLPLGAMKLKKRKIQIHRGISEERRRAMGLLIGAAIAGIATVALSAIGTRLFMAESR
jgi:hypothetical protein